jgi:hypothetical protein
MFSGLQSLLFDEPFSLKISIRVAHQKLCFPLQMYPCSQIRGFHRHCLWSSISADIEVAIVMALAKMENCQESRQLVPRSQSFVLNFSQWPFSHFAYCLKQLCLVLEVFVAVHLWVVVFWFLTLCRLIL